MSSPLVSVVIPVFNSEKTIKRTLDSVLDQSIKNIELFIVNDASKDNLHSVLQPYRNNKRIIVINNRENLGRSLSRNIAIEASKGQFIAFLDSDDSWRPDKLERQIRFMTNNKYAVSYTGYSMIDVNDGNIRRVSVPHVINYECMLKGSSIGLLTSVIDTNMLGKRYFRDLKKREDYVYWLDILREGYIAGGLDEDLAIYSNDARIVRKLSLAKHQWRVYRDIEGFSLRRSAYYFYHYSFRGVNKHYI